MKHPIVEAITRSQMENINHPEMSTGDTVTVSLNVKEGSRERIQKYKGVIIAMKNRGISSTITVRKMTGDNAIERVLPIYSKQVAKIEVDRLGDVNQAKIYYQRQRSGRAARIKQARAKKKVSS